MKTKPTFLSLSFMAIIFIVWHCKKEIINVSPPANIVYVLSDYIGSAGIADSGLAPSIRWNNEIGKFSISAGSKTGIYINSGTGKLSWNSYLPVGTYAIKVQARNSAGISEETPLSLTIQAIAPGTLQTNSDSVFVSYSELGGSISTTAASIKWNGNSGSFKILSGGFTGLSIDTLTGVLTCTKNAAKGVHTVSLQASNNAGISPIKKINISIGNAPDYMFYTPDSVNLPYQTTFASTTPIFNDNGSLPLIYSIVNPPAGISVNATTGIINIDNTLAFGTYNIQTRATNYFGSVTSRAFKIKSTASVGTFAYDPEALKIYQGKSTDISPVSVISTSNISYALTGTPVSGLSINAANAVLTCDGTTAINTYAISIKATNTTNGAVTTVNYSLIVQEAPSPVINSLYRIKSGVEQILSNIDTIFAGNELLIKGNFFSANNADINISINGGNAFPPTSASRSAFNFIVPNDVIGGKNAANTIIAITVNSKTTNATNVPWVGFSLDPTTTLSKNYVPGTSTSFSNELITISGKGFSNTPSDWSIIVFDGNVLPVTITPSAATANLLTFAAPNQYGKGKVSVVNLATGAKKTTATFNDFHIPAFDSMILVDIYNAMGGASWGKQNGWLITNLSASTLETDFSPGGPLAGDSKLYTITTSGAGGWKGVVLQTFASKGITTSYSSSNDIVSRTHPESNGIYRVSRIYANDTSYVSTKGLNNWVGTLPASIGGTAPVSGFANTMAAFPSDIASTYIYKGGLTRLKVLSINGYSVYGSIPTSFANLAYINTFQLNGNLLTGSLPDGLGTNGGAFQYTASGGIGTAVTYTIGTNSNLSLHNNNLTGNIPLSLRNSSNFAGWTGTIIARTTAGICYQNKKVANSGTPPLSTNTTPTLNKGAAEGGDGFNNQSSPAGCPARWW